MIKIPKPEFESHKYDTLIRPEIPILLKTFKKVIFDYSYLAAHALLNGPLKGALTAVFDEVFKTFKNYKDKL